MAFLSPIEFNVGLLSALNLSLPTNQAKLRQILVKAAAKQQILAELSQILTQKTLQSFGKAADAAAFYQGLGLEAPRELSPPDEFTPKPGVVSPPGVACPDRYKTGECRKKGVSGTDVYIDSLTEDTSAGADSMTLFATEGVSEIDVHIDSCTEGTSAGADSMTLFATEGSEAEPEEFLMGADVRCFVTSSLSNNPREVLTPHKATGMPLPPVWVCADQVQQGGHCCPQEIWRDQQLLKQINKQQRLLEQRRRILPQGVGIVRKL